MGVIDSLSAGYRFLGRRLELLLIPVLLDLLFWLGPRLSVASLFKQAAVFYSEAASVEGMPTDMVEMSKQMAAMLNQSGENTNMLTVLANSSLLHVPSLIASLGPAGGVLSNSPAIDVENPLVALLLFIGFSLLGVLIGVVYMNLLARTLPIGDAPKAMSFGAFVEAVLRQWLMVLLYVAILVLVLIIGSIPVTLATALLALISPLIGSLIVVLVGGILLILTFYLYFVTAGVVMDNLPAHRAIAQSFVMVRNNFWPTIGFILLYSVISLGFAFIMRSLVGLTPVGTLVAILIYAYIGSGLAMALLVFYRTRILKQDEKLVSVA